MYFHFAVLDFCAQMWNINLLKLFTWEKRSTHEHVIHYIASEVKMTCSCYPKAKVIESRVQEQNINCPSFVMKARHLAHRQNKNGMDSGLRIGTADC